MELSFKIGYTVVKRFLSFFPYWDVGCVILHWYTCIMNFCLSGYVFYIFSKALPGLDHEEGLCQTIFREHVLATLTTTHILHRTMTSKPQTGDRNPAVLGHFSYPSHLVQCDPLKHLVIFSRIIPYQHCPGRLPRAIKTVKKM